MLEDTAFDLGYTSFEATNQVLRMVDQSRVLPIGRLSQVPTVIGEMTYLLNYVVIRVHCMRIFWDIDFPTTGAVLGIYWRAVDLGVARYIFDIHFDLQSINLLDVYD